MIERLESAAMTEFLTLPSGGDTSYAGMAWHDGLLWLSYYSSDDYLASMKDAIGAHLQTSVYLATVQLQTADPCLYSASLDPSTRRTPAPATARSHAGQK